MKNRQESGVPWHDLPCRDSGNTDYLISAACYEHQSIIGASRNRIDRFADELLETVNSSPAFFELHAWVVLPNHYHLLGHVSDIRATKTDLGKLHGRSSMRWNREDRTRGRRVWFRAAETVIKSPRHFQATVNYLHRNLVKHQCVAEVEEWPWSSFSEWQSSRTPKEIKQQWSNFPTEHYGKGWDEDSLAEVSANLLE